MSTQNPSPAPMVIVGAGHVGGRAAQVLREQGWSGEIVLVGDEPHAPYERPPLSKGMLTGEVDAVDGTVASAETLERLGVRRHLGRVRALDPKNRSVQLDDGSSLNYTACLLATGGRPRRLSIPGAVGPGLFEVRTLEDARRLAPRLREGARAVIVGGGFIGLEVAASARLRGCQVTVLEGAPRLLGRAVPAVVGEAVARLHESHGIDLRLGVMPEAIEPMIGGALRLHLSDGQTLSADFVVVGIGIEPAVELAREAGLEVDRGVRVNRELEASVPGVFAAGDVAEFPGVLSGQWQRQETWHNAEAQARTAARNMLGAHAAHADLPWFWSDQYDHQLQVAGEPALAARTVTRTLSAPGGDPGVALHFNLDAQGRLVGMSGFGPASVVVKELKLARTLLERGVHPDPEALADPAVKLKSLLNAVAA